MLARTVPVSLFILLLAGCQKPDPLGGMKFGDTYAPNQRVITDEKNQPAVLVGKPPQMYFVSFACTVRVMEMGSQKTLATATARHGDYVSIDVKDGIRIGDSQVKKPLDATLRYGIFLDDR